jgi:hypothetical protein
MKVEPKNSAAVEVRPAAVPSFKSLMSQHAQKPPGGLSHTTARAVTQPTKVASAIPTVAQALSAKRAQIETDAGRLNEVRGALMARANDLATSRTEAVTPELAHVPAKAIDAITRELITAFGPQSRVANDGEPPSGRPHAEPQPLAPVWSTPTPPPISASPEQQAAQAVALIEKIEFFVRTAQRPAIALTLNNSLGARVEIERVGPREVALKLIGHRGPPTPEAVSRVREELLARGLKIATMEVA